MIRGGKTTTDHLVLSKAGLIKTKMRRKIILKTNRKKKNQRKREKFSKIIKMPQRIMEMKRAVGLVLPDVMFIESIDSLFCQILFMFIY